MHRTNLYLTTDQERALDARARAAGVSRSELVRRIIDRELSAPQQVGAELEDALVRLADVYIEVGGSLFDEDPDLSIPR